MPQNRRKKQWFLRARKSFSTSRNKIFFENWISQFPQTEQKSLNKRTLLQQDRSCFPLAGMENLFKNKILLDGKTASIGRNFQKIKENG